MPYQAGRARARAHSHTKKQTNIVAKFGYNGLGHLCGHSCAQQNIEDTMRPSILNSLINTIQTHIGFTYDLNELQEMKQEALRGLEHHSKDSSFDHIKERREASAAMYKALIQLIDVQAKDQN